jgi:hypothetical protein
MDKKVAAEWLLNRINDFYNLPYDGKEITWVLGNPYIWVYTKSDDCAPKWMNSGPVDGWKDDQCKEIGVRRFARQVDDNGTYNWEAAADNLIHNKLPAQLNGNAIDRTATDKNNGMWVWAYTKDVSCNPKWIKTGEIAGGWKDDGCVSPNQRRYSRQIDDNGIRNWEAAADFAIKNMAPKIGEIFEGKKVVDVQSNKHFGMYIWLFVEDDSCQPKWGDWDKRECTGKGERHYASRLWGLSDASKDKWKEQCEVALKNPGLAGDVINRECAWYAWEMWGNLYLRDAECNSENASVIENQPKAGESLPSCYPDGTGPHGTIGDVAQQPLKVGSKFTLEALNWITGNKGKKTFLKGKGGGIWTDDNVAPVSGPSMADKYIFAFQRDGCEPADWLMYGSHVQLKSIGSNKIILCGGGTCSGVDDTGKCKVDKWQTFTIESAEGKQGKVCYGDNIYIAQVVGGHAAITPAGGGNTWAVNMGDNENSILRIQGPNGSIFADPSVEMADYEKTRVDELCKRDPANAICTGNSLANAFSLGGHSLANAFSLGGHSLANAFSLGGLLGSWKTGLIILAVICLLCSASAAYMKLRSFF